MKSILTILVCAIVFGAYCYASQNDIADAQAAEAHKRETIAAARKEFARQKLAGLTDDANRMMHPIAQARTP